MQKARTRLHNDASAHGGVRAGSRRAGEHHVWMSRAGDGGRGRTAANPLPECMGSGNHGCCGDSGGPKRCGDCGDFSRDSGLSWAAAIIRIPRPYASRRYYEPRRPQVVRLPGLPQRRALRRAHGLRRPHWLWRPHHLLPPNGLQRLHRLWRHAQRCGNAQRCGDSVGSGVTMCSGGPAVSGDSMFPDCLRSHKHASYPRARIGARPRSAGRARATPDAAPRTERAFSDTTAGRLAAQVVLCCTPLPRARLRPQRPETVASRVLFQSHRMISIESPLDGGASIYCGDAMGSGGAPATPRTPADQRAVAIPPALEAPTAATPRAAQRFRRPRRPGATRRAPRRTTNMFFSKPTVPLCFAPDDGICRRWVPRAL